MNFLTPDVHNITNSLSCICLKIKIVKDNRKDKGINLELFQKDLVMNTESKLLLDNHYQL